MRFLLIGPQAPPLGGMAVFFESIKEQLAAEPISVIFLPTNPDLPRIYPIISKLPAIRTLASSAWFLFDLIRLLPKVDVVFLMGASNEYFYLRLLPALALTKVFRKKSILNYHGGGLGRFIARSRFPVALALRWPDLVAVPNEYLQEVFASLDVEAQILRNFVDLSRFEFRERIEPPKSIVSTRNFEEVYNLQLLLHAVSLVQKAGYDVSLTLIGDGSKRTELEQLAADLGLHQVVFTGRIDNASLPDHLASADLFVNSSRSDNLPISLIEAMASGLPVVSTKVGGIPYLIRCEDEGLLVPSENPQTMAEAIIRLLGDASLRKRLSEGGRKRAEDFSWEVVRNDFFALIEGIS